METLTQKKFHYGWIILGLACLMGFIVMTFTVTPMSLFIVPVTEDLGFARSSFTLAQTCQFIGVIISSLLFGQINRKIGTRASIGIGAIVQAAGYFIMSVSTQLPMFYAGGFVIGFASGLCAVSAASTIVNTWFAKNSGFMVGIVFTCTSLGGIVWNPVIGSWIDGQGWSQAYRTCAILIFCVGLLLFLLVRTKPEDMNLKPVWQDRLDREVEGKKTVEVRGLTGRQALKTEKLKLCLLLIFLCGIAIPPTMAIAPSYLAELGLNAAVLWGVANTCALAVNTISKVPLSALADKKGVRYMITIALTGFIAGILCFLTATPSTTYMVFVGAGVMGFAVLMTSNPMPIIVREFFGNRDFATIMGWIFAAISCGQAVGTPAMNLVYDVLGSYRYVYYGLLPIAVIIFIIGQLACSKNPKQLIVKGEDSNNEK